MAAGGVISAFITEQLNGARQRRANVEARGMAVITSAGVIVTLQLGFLAVSPKTEGEGLPVGARLFAATSLIALLAAAALGILTNLPEKTREANPSTMQVHLQEPHWSADGSQASKAIAQVQLVVLETATSIAFRKGRILWWAFIAELAGIAMLTVATLLLLVR